MNETQYKKAMELKNEVDEYRDKYLYFCTERYKIYPNQNQVLQEEKNPFRFRLKKKDKVVCEIGLQGYAWNGDIEVDIDFINYCAEYFKKKLEDAKKAFEEF